MDSPSPHPTDQTLHNYGLGKLDDATAESVNSHLESCPPCRKRTADISSDSFLSRFREGKSTDGVNRPASGQSLAGSAAQFPIGTLPPQLADHKDYEVVRELGRGGMGVVYLVRNRLMGRNEVLKVMAGHLVARPEVQERFLREIRAVASLRHPNIVAAHHAFHVGESIAFTMEYVEGYDLSKMVKARGPLPVAHACLFAHQAALGLQHAHEEGMVHRDIKPGNLMVAHRGEKAVVKVLDFGLAKAAREGTFDSALTHAGQMLGTPDFIAPEQATDAQSADIRADIYSLGCTLYYLLTGGPPFRATSLYDLLQAHHSMDAKLLNFVRPEVPTELAALVAKMMAKEPERRFQTPASVSEALAPFCKGGNSARPAAPEVSQAAPPEARRPAPTPKPTPTAPTTSPSLESPKPADAPRPERMWASLIDVREKESEAEAASAKPATSGPTRRPPWKSRKAIAAASLFGLVILGILIYISIDKDGFKFVARTDKAAPEGGTRDSTAGGGTGPDKQPDAELVAFYDFDDATATDRSGHGHHGTPSGNPPTFTPDGHEKGALSFDRARKNFIVVPVDINPSPMPQITMGGWFRARSADSVRVMLSNDSDGYGRLLGIDSHEKTGHRWSTATSKAMLLGGPVAVGQWTFVAMRHDQATSTLVFDVDGWHFTTKAYFGAGHDDLSIGRRPKYGAWFDGDMDNLFIYKAFLSDAKIADIRARGRAAILPPSEQGGAVSLFNGKDLTTGGSPTNAGSGPNALVGKPPVPPARVAALSDGPAPVAADFTPLFNGKDTTGWKTHSAQPGNWRAENGILVGSGPAISHLYTDRGDYGDFHLRAVARYHGTGHSAVFVRASDGPEPAKDEPFGYEVSINSTDDARGYTGGLWSFDDTKECFEERVRVPPRQWFTMDILASDDTLSVFINGRLASIWIEKSRRYSVGHIALQQTPDSIIEFRSIAVRGIDRDSRPDPREVARLIGHGGRVSAVAISPDAKRVLSDAANIITWHPGNPRTENHSVRLWDAVEGRFLRFVSGPPPWVRSMAFSPDGKYSVSCGGWETR